MQDSQYSLFSGRTLKLGNGTSTYGNIFHLYTGRRFTLISGEAILTLQQAAIRGTSGQMEVLSAAMSLNDSGQVDLVFPTAKIEIKLQEGQCIEIAPGFAYGWTAAKECTLLETQLPGQYPYTEVKQSISSAFVATDSDAIDFDLGIGKVSTPPLVPQERSFPYERVEENLSLSEAATEPYQEPKAATEAYHKPESATETYQEPESATEIYQEPELAMARPALKQRFYKRALLSGFAYLGLLLLILIFLTITIGNTGLTSFSLLYIIILMTILYLGYTEIRDLYEQKPLLCIISDGVVITNRLYRDMPMRWQDLHTISIEAKTGLMNSSHLKIALIPHNEQFPIDYLKPEYRLIYNYMCKLKFTPPIPPIHISELDLEESLTLLYDDLKALHAESTKPSRQLSS